jgi:hypothetical protein
LTSFDERIEVPSTVAAEKLKGSEPLSNRKWKKRTEEEQEAVLNSFESVSFICIYWRDLTFAL